MHYVNLHFYIVLKWTVFRCHISIGLYVISCNLILSVLLLFNNTYFMALSEEHPQ